MKEKKNCMAEILLWFVYHL